MFRTLHRIVCEYLFGTILEYSYVRTSLYYGLALVASLCWFDERTTQTGDTNIPCLPSILPRRKRLSKEQHILPIAPSSRSSHCFLVLVPISLLHCPWPFQNIAWSVEHYFSGYRELTHYIYVDELNTRCLCVLDHSGSSNVIPREDPR